MALLDLCRGVQYLQYCPLVPYCLWVRDHLVVQYLLYFPLDPCFLLHLLHPLDLSNLSSPSSPDLLEVPSLLYCPLAPYRLDQSLLWFLLDLYFLELRSNPWDLYCLSNLWDLYCL